MGTGGGRCVQRGLLSYRGELGGGKKRKPASFERCWEGERCRQVELCGLPVLLLDRLTCEMYTLKLYPK